MQVKTSPVKSSKKTINIGLIGLGNVGQSVYKIITQRNEVLSNQLGKSINVNTIAVSNVNKKRDIDLANTTLTADSYEIVNDPTIDIVIEAIGGESPAKELIETALKNKKHVITANKELISKHKQSLFNLAKENEVELYYEAAVGGGIPLIKALKIGFGANKIMSFYGILNGTTNYILTKLNEGTKEFEEVLKDAQTAGFAEADPTMDISGLDTAYKLDILGAVAFKRDIQVENIYYEGITNISKKDIAYANELGYSIKLLAIGKRLENEKILFKVHPTLIDKQHPLASVNNEMNAIYIEGNFIGNALLSGKGAGGDPTASAVVSDLIDVINDLDNVKSKRNIIENIKEDTPFNINESTSQFFVRLLVPDSIGVLEKITKTISENNINISKIIQKDTTDGTAEIVIVTHPVVESEMKSALEQLVTDKLSNEILSTIRVGIN